MKGIMEHKAQEMNSIFMTYMMVELTKKTVLNEDVQKLLNDPKEHFDAVIVEWMFGDSPAG